MKIIISPQDKELLNNHLLLPSLIHMIMLKHSSITHMPLLQQPTVHEGYIEIELLTENELSAVQEEEVKQAILKLLNQFFVITEDEVDVSWE